MADSGFCASVWKEALSIIENNKSIQPTSYHSWFEPLKVLDCNNTCIYLGSKSDFIINWINNQYSSLLTDAIREASGGKITSFKLILLNEDGTYDKTGSCEEEEEDQNQPVESKPVPQPEEEIYSSNLNPNYTFDTFVVGDRNRFAHAASLAIAETPGKLYNPLFIYGGVGLGKTHLMHAIGHFIKENNSNAKVTYFTTERFVNEWIASIRDNTPDKFRKKYRKFDVILMDDIQFLSKKVSSQEEFFHTYNALFESGAQIILSSDRHPNDIPDIEERLVSRFLWGLTTEIEPPDLETRIAILEKKAALSNVYINQKNKDVFFYIANRFESNIRILEGAFNRVIHLSTMKNEPITLSLTMEALEGFAAETKNKVITIELIQQAIVQYFHVKADDLLGPKRDTNIVNARQIAMYLCRDMIAKSTFKEIGDAFNRHHSSVMHSYNEVCEKVKNDKQTEKTINELKKRIQNL